MGRKKRRFETKISAFLRDFGRIAASSFPHTLKKPVIPIPLQRERDLPIIITNTFMIHSCQ